MTIEDKICYHKKVLDELTYKRSVAKKTNIETTKKGPGFELVKVR